MKREHFIKTLGLASAGMLLAPSIITGCAPKAGTDSATSADGGNLFFKISLAQWSLHKALKSGQIKNIDFPSIAKNEYGIDAVEYVNQFFQDHATDQAYLTDLKNRCSDLGVTNVLIMCDDEGELANADAAVRKKSAENHYKWVDAAKFLGCHSIRVNCFGSGTAEEVAKQGADGLHILSEYASQANINVIVENHGGYSSDGQWLTGVIKSVNMGNCGILPDFGNFCTRREKGDMWESPCLEWYDKYKGVEEMMPFAKGVSAKSYTFDESGNCREVDFERMLGIVKAAGYTGHIGIEFEGEDMPEPDGIRATKKLLETAGKKLS
jgi:sugar phosphate isomerase/epimerase